MFSAIKFKIGLIYMLLIGIGLLLIGGCSLWTGGQPEDPVVEETTDQLKDKEEEPEALPSPCDLEEPEKVPEEAEPEPEKVDQNGEQLNDEEQGAQESDLKVIADGDYLLALVTKETKLKSDYVPHDLEPIPSYMNPSYSMQLRSEALKHLKKLWQAWQAAKEDEVILSIRSAYRSYSTQKGLFQDYASRHGEEEANRFSARPGQSEHQLGTTVDFGGTAYDWSPEFANTDQGWWLAENAYKYGFAMSYPEGKEHITGYIFEPWHYRYIGVDAAREWKESGKTLREYLETKPQEFVE